MTKTSIDGRRDTTESTPVGVVEALARLQRIADGADQWDVYGPEWSAVGPLAEVRKDLKTILSAAAQQEEQGSRAVPSCESKHADYVGKCPY